MPHVDDETLALLALGEDVATVDQQRHLAGCADCTAALAGLRETAALGRSALAVGALAPPAPRVWAGIEQELGLRPAARHAPVARRPARRRAVIAALAIAAVVAVAAIGTRLLVPAAPQVVATATLAGLPAWPGASGQATVERAANGLVLDLRLESRTTPTRFREVWLITADQRTLISLGVLRGSSGVFRVPKGLDLARYDLVDVSSEPHDGNPRHSGDSIVRGALRAGA